MVVELGGVCSRVGHHHGKSEPTLNARLCTLNQFTKMYTFHVPTRVGFIPCFTNDRLVPRAVGHYIQLSF